LIGGNLFKDMRTKYFTTKKSDYLTIKIWRYNSYSDSDGYWYVSSCKLNNDDNCNGRSWYQISRDEARKIESKAFRT
jgi:hypothetical protein